MTDGGVKPTFNWAARLRAGLDAAHRDLRNGNVAAGMWRLVRHLSGVRSSLLPAEWRAAVHAVAAHPITTELAASPLVARRRSARGASTDATSIDMIYGICDDADVLGAAIYRFECRMPSIAGMRAACQHVRDELLRLAVTRPDGSVLALSCAHMRELDATVLARFGPGAQFVAVDSDPEALASIGRRIVDSRLTTICAKAQPYLAAPSPPRRRFDLIYSVVPDPGGGAGARRETVTQAFDLLQPGGMLLLASPARDRADAGYLEACLGLWPAGGDDERLLRHRSAGLTGCSERSFYREPHGTFVFSRFVRRLGA